MDCGAAGGVGGTPEPLVTDYFIVCGPRPGSRVSGASYALGRLLLSEKENVKEHSLAPLQPSPALSHDSASRNWHTSVRLPLRGI